jgi:hypothetical protein
MTLFLFLILSFPQKIEKITKCGQVVASSWQYKEPNLFKKFFIFAGKLPKKIVGK